MDAINKSIKWTINERELECSSWQIVSTRHMLAIISFYGVHAVIKLLVYLKIDIFNVFTV